MNVKVQLPEEDACSPVNTVAGMGTTRTTSCLRLTAGISVPPWACGDGTPNLLSTSSIVLSCTSCVVTGSVVRSRVQHERFPDLFHLAPPPFPRLPLRGLCQQFQHRTHTPEAGVTPVMLKPNASPSTTLTSW